MKAHRLFMPLAITLVTLTGCASSGGPLNGSEAQLSPQERRLQELENKVVVLTRRLDAVNLTGFDQENNRLKEELRGLRGTIEKLQYDADNRDRAAKDQYADIDRRLQRIESNAAAAAAQQPGQLPTIGGGQPGITPGGPPGTFNSPSPAPRSEVATPEETKAYLEAFDLLRNYKYAEAIQGFRAMLDQWPQGRYADSAWYYIGEANFAGLRDYSSALGSYQTLVDRFPTSPRISDSLLRVGLCQIELKRTAEAKGTLQRVLRDYAGTPAAGQAKQKLDQLG